MCPSARSGLEFPAASRRGCSDQLIRDMFVDAKIQSVCIFRLSAAVQIFVVSKVSDYSYIVWRRRLLPLQSHDSRLLMNKPLDTFARLLLFFFFFFPLSVFVLPHFAL